MMNDLIINKTSNKAFDNFNKKYQSKIVEICPPLNKISINIIEHTKSYYWNVGNFNEYDPFGYYIEKSSDIKSTYAEIIINFEMCNRLRFNNDEMLAALAHEIGHIITFFRKDKNEFNIQQEEIYSDG